MQLLSQRKSFVELEDDPIQGGILNEKMGEVKSSSDRLRKGTIVRILEQEGLLPIVGLLGSREGSGSIGQVNKIKLERPIVVEGVEYHEAAVKAKRPSALKHLSEDFDILWRMARYFGQLYPEHAISEKMLERAKLDIHDELKFEQEVSAQRRFYMNMSKRKSKMRVPLVFYAKEKEPLLMLQEFVKGTLLGKLPDTQQSPKTFVRILDEFFQQVFIDGFWHADLHDRNVIVETEDKDVLIDLGGNGEVVQEKKKTLFNIFEALVMNRENKLFEGLRAYGVELDAEIISEVRKILQDSEDSGQRLEKVFFALADAETTVPRSLLMFFQALSKVGVYFDHINLLQKVRLFAKWKGLILLHSTRKKKKEKETMYPTVIMPKVTSDTMMMAEDTKYGGIDLNPNQIDFAVEQEGEGVRWQFDPHELENMQIEGFLPVIINITPVTNLHLLLGISEKKKEPQLSRL